MGTNSKSSHQCYVLAPTVMASADGTAGAMSHPVDQYPQAELDITTNPAAVEPAPDTNGAPSDTAEPADQDIDEPIPWPDSAPNAADETAAEDGVVDPANQPLTPIPDTPTPGQACGQPVLVGG